MEYAIKKKNNGTRLVRVVCTIVFLLFTFCYVNFYQDDVLLVCQHVLSGGQTHYVRSVGTPLIVLVLWLIQWVACRVSGVNRRFYWLTFLPSFALLAAITGVDCVSFTQYTWQPWCWLLPLLWLLSALGLWLAHQLQPYEQESPDNPLFSRLLWSNMLAFLAMMFVVGWVSNPDELFHYRARTEVLISEGKYGDALQVGRESLQTDSTLTMLRIYALAKTGRLGDGLFCYPLAGGSGSMSPIGQGMHLLLLTPQALAKDIKSPKMQCDYRLCSLLLDRRLDEFARLLQSSYSIGARLPRHYREALYLYTHTRSNPVVTVADNVMDADFEDFEKLTHSAESAVRDAYGNTYWYYYKFGKSNPKTHL